MSRLKKFLTLSLLGLAGLSFHAQATISFDSLPANNVNENTTPALLIEMSDPDVFPSPHAITSLSILSGADGAFFQLSGQTGIGTGNAKA
ncbi:MAG: hypothetical protein ACI8Z1_002352, partial [Candidatus Azotimanducaceae bacterium]